MRLSDRKVEWILGGIGGNLLWEAEQMYRMCFNPSSLFICQLAYVSGRYLSDHIELSQFYIPRD